MTTENRPPSNYKWKMFWAGITITVLLGIFFTGINAFFVAVAPGPMNSLLEKGEYIITALFQIEEGETVSYNTKNVFIIVFILVFFILGLYHYLKQWALWLCSREKEKNTIVSWLPNVFHSSEAEEKFALINEDKKIEELQEKVNDMEQEQKQLQNYIELLKQSVKETFLDRRLVFNLDNLIGKSFNQLHSKMRNSENDINRLKMFLNSVCSEICSTTVNTNNDKHAYIFLKNDEEDMMVLVGESRGGSNIDGTPKFKKGEGFVGKLWSENKDDLITDIKENASGIIETNGERRYNSIIGKRILYKNEIIGIIVVTSQLKDEVSEEDFSNLERYVHLILMSLLIETSNIIQKGGDEDDFLLKALKKQSDKIDY